MDRVLAFLLVPVFLFVFLLISVPQLISFGRIFFFQQRPGLNGTPFILMKFQTMRTGEGADEERVTTYGSVIRKLALDELPQILNILKGEMSFVGPRPLLPEYLPLYNKYHRKRHLAKPGITGLSQVRGGSITTWQEKLDTDVFYVENLSFALDMKIIIKTVKLLFFKAGRKKELINTRFTGYEH